MTNTIGILPLTESITAPASTDWRLLSTIAIMVVPLIIGTWFAFPLYDDGWMKMMISESTPSAMNQFMPDRPIFGVILKILCSWGGSGPGLYVFVSVGLWTIFAFQCGWLWHRLFPEADSYACLAGAAALAPVFVQCQLCTLMIVIPCVLPVVLVLAGLLMVLRSSGGHRAPIVAMLSFGVAVLISEYALAAIGASLILLLARAKLTTNRQLQKWRIFKIALMGGGAGVAYVVFLNWAKLETTRPSISPSLVLSIVANKFPSVLTNLANSFFHSIVGAYAQTLADLDIHWDSRSSLAAMAAGLFLGSLFCWMLKGRPAPVWKDAVPIYLSALAVGTMVGLLPVVLMGRDASMHEFGSRFMIPILPFAICLSLFLFLELPRRNWLWVIVMGWGLICGNSMVSAVFKAQREMSVMTLIGSALLPQMSENDYTVAITSKLGMDYEFTPRATSTWPQEKARKFWLFDRNAGESIYGHRFDCTDKADLQKEVRGVTRIGPLARLLWVEVRNQQIVSIEPYCQLKVKTN